ncbi:MAG TPA: hypothetical protein VNE67_17535 [Acetobacteraceae bacterium]|nr:hypothetical protein [Acetobacteraceae bacterium]
MRRMTVLAAAAALAIAGGSTGVALVAHAAPPPPPPGPAGGPPAHGPHGGPGWAHWMHHGHWRHHKPLITPGTFALLFHPADREITTADAQEIATGFLRWNGNHTWKVVDVKQMSDGKIGFSYATADNSVIASFTIDSRTGRIRRVG